VFRKNVYILGAGFSANAGAPVMWDFIERAKLLRDDPRLELPAEDHKAFERVFKKLGELRVAQAKMEIDIENIEHLFSLLDMDIEFGGKREGTLRKDLIFLILRTLEKTIRTENLAKYARGLPMQQGYNKQKYSKSVLANYVELFSAYASRRWITGPFGIPPQDGKCQDTIITMNYDCLVDDCLTSMGVRPAYALQDAELPTELRLCGYEIGMLKLHGSANWFKCNSARCNETIVIAGETPAKRLEYFYGQHCPNCRQNEIEPVIVPPTWAKGGESEVLRPVWAEALRALREAGRVFVIGYSMPSTDEFFGYMLALALATNEGIDKVIVVNPSSDAQQTFEKLFHSQFGARKLKPMQSKIEAYVTEGDGLGFELGQYQTGFNEATVRDSGFTVQ
jgi:NAD-dependent SIR2 family protein deacetylase